MVSRGLRKIGHSARWESRGKCYSSVPSFSRRTGLYIFSVPSNASWVTTCGRSRHLRPFLLIGFRLINALGAGERIALSRLAVSHLEREKRPIRVAVDISIWLFQVQAGRGGKNPEIRTLFYRLIKLLALPIHPLFVYDGNQKPPFKRGKATTSRGHGNSPIIQRSKDLISRFKFPWHVAPGEAEAECARLQRAGIVDAVMSDDIDTLMFGSTFMIKNFSKESGSGTAAATHVTRYNMSSKVYTSNVPFDRAGMILFAMLSGGDYLPSGVPKCGSKLAAEIAKAGFGEDLLEILASHPSDLDSKLNDWRDRLQFELEENESGYFTTKHKAVRIPQTFPDRGILEYYAEPSVSTENEMEILRRRLRQTWDQDIDPLAIRSFTAEHLEWNYRSGARKLIKLLAEPLVSYRLRLQRPVLGLTHGTLAPDCDTPWLQKIHRSRATFGTDGMTELQTDMLPVDVVGIDLLAEPPNPQLSSEESGSLQKNTAQSIEEEDDAEAGGEAASPPTPSKARVTRRFDPLGIEKVWVFEAVAKLGVPEIVKKWEDEQADKAASKAAPKKTTSRRTGPKKKGPIDPGMKRGSILKYGTLTKERSEPPPTFKTRLFEAATSASKDGNSFHDATSYPEHIDLEEYQLSPSMYPKRDNTGQMSVSSQEVDDLVGTFSNLSTMSPTPTSKRHPMANQLRMQSRTGVLSTGMLEFDDLGLSTPDTVISTPSRLRRRIEISTLSSTEGSSDAIKGSTTSSMMPLSQKKHPQRERVHEVDELEKAIGSLSLVVTHDSEIREHSPPRRCRQPASPRKAESGRNRFVSSPQKLDHSKSPQKNPSSSNYQSANSSGSVILSEVERETEGPPVGHAFKVSNEVSRSPTKTKSSGPTLEQTIGHAENVTTSNGFWKVNTCAEPAVTSAVADDLPLTAESTTDDGRRGQRKKKRIPRVSILDMI